MPSVAFLEVLPGRVPGEARFKQAFLDRGNALSVENLGLCDSLALRHVGGGGPSTSVGLSTPALPTILHDPAAAVSVRS
jgi:hypothetical protein